MNVEDLKQKEYEGSKGESRSGKEDADMLDRLVRDGEWTELRHNGRYQKLSTEGEIIKALDAVKVRERAINKLFYEELAENPVGSATIHEKSLVKLRKLQKALRARFVGELDQEDAPREMTTVLDISVPTPQTGNRGSYKKAA